MRSPRGGVGKSTTSFSNNPLSVNAPESCRNASTLSMPSATTPLRLVIDPTVVVAVLVVVVRVVLVLVVVVPELVLVVVDVAVLVLDVVVDDVVVVAVVVVAVLVVLVLVVVVCVVVVCVTVTWPACTLDTAMTLTVNAPAPTWSTVWQGC